MRPDKRGPSTVRVMNSGLAVLGRSDGSAKFLFGDSGVLCGINGPMTVKFKDEILDRATISVIYTPCTGSGGPSDRFIESFIRQTAEALILSQLHPRTAIKLNCQALADDGCILAAAVNAMVLALLDAGVPMKSTGAAVTCLINKDGELLLDPTALELKDAQSTHTFVFDQSSLSCIAIHSTGLFTEEEV
ncbi:ribosomal protein S5 domain 2-type protein [Globomyces pollinis-pini]|nr:ribosomal protein S5 domain 2-type protein [Globomyces pollinis-pini]